MTLEDLRCSECNALLVRIDLRPGSRIACKCHRCNHLNALTIATPSVACQDDHKGAYPTEAG